jgi:hypothetical protein
MIFRVMKKVKTMRSPLSNAIGFKSLTWACIGLTLLLGFTQAQSAGPTIKSRDLPTSLYSYWVKQKPDLGSMGHCAVAFDSGTDERKMAYGCSVFIKMSAQGERKALQYCETMRANNQIKAPCQLVVE